MADFANAQLGPWPGGMRLTLPADKIQDDELALIINAQLDQIGNLHPRPPFTKTKVGTGIAPYKDIVAVYSVNDPLAGPHVFCSENRAGLTGIQSYSINSAGVPSSPSALNGPGVSIAGDMTLIPYRDNIYMFSAGKVYKTSSIGQMFNNLHTWSNFTTWPGVGGPTNKGWAIIKDRLFTVDQGGASNPNRIYYSKATDFTVWASPDGGFFDIISTRKSGNPFQTFINRLIVFNDSLYIFTDYSVHVLIFDDDPATGTLQLITDRVGALDACVVNNRLFAVNAAGVFEIIGNNFISISEKIVSINRVFGNDSTSSPTLVGFYGALAGGDDRLFAYAYLQTEDFNRFNGVDLIWEKDIFNGILVYDLRYDNWVFWTIDSKFPVADEDGAFSSAHVEDKIIYEPLANMLLMMGGDNDEIIRYALIDYHSTDFDHFATPNALFYYPRTYIKTKQYVLNDESIWKQLFRVYGSVLHWVNKFSALPFSLKLRFNDTTLDSYTEETYLKNVPVTADQAESTPVMGFLPFMQRRFKRVQAVIDINSTETGNVLSRDEYWWTINNFILYVKSKVKMPDRVI